jgi:ribonucleoside-diphosphate reductase alpha chain
MEASMELAKEKGPYATYKGSPVSKGLFQFDLWEREGAINEFEKVGSQQMQILFDKRQPWDKLKKQVAKYGVRNSLLVAPMPTASTSYIMGNSPCFEPFNSNVYKRDNKIGEFVIVNKFLINDLLDISLWDDNMKNKLIMANGRIQEILEIPKVIRDLYKTAWDISPKIIINLALSRAIFIDQSMSMNLFIKKPSPKILTQVHFYSWRRGLKTGSYYIHSRPPVDAQKLQVVDQQTVEMHVTRTATPQPEDAQANEPLVYGEVCTMDEGCISCGS